MIVTPEQLQELMMEVEKEDPIFILPICHLRKTICVI